MLVLRERSVPVPQAAVVDCSSRSSIAASGRSSRRRVPEAAALALVVFVAATTNFIIAIAIDAVVTRLVVSAGTSPPGDDGCSWPQQRSW